MMTLSPSCIFLMTLVLLACLWQSVTAAAGYQCYICSWSPRDTNRTDNCTEDNFDARNVHSDTCELGCEIFVQWDPNGSLDQWRRNCVSKSSAITHGCQTDQTVAWHRKRCTCTSDFCNAAVSSGPIFSLGALAALIACKRFF